ncbi:MAG: HD domain-containing protein [Clostridia bacterium]|nr:HD domain-containing protein [Clostridia bacterium]
MISLRKTIKKILVGIFIFIAFVLVINFYFVPITKSSMNDSSEDLHKILTQIVGMDLPVRVLDNIREQVILDSENLDNDKLIIAFTNNRDKLLSLSTDVEEQLMNLNEDLKKVNRLSLNLYRHSIDQMMASIEVMVEQSINIKSFLESVTIENLSIAEINSLEKELSSSIEGLELLNRQLNDNILNVFTWMINIMFILLIMMLLLLSFGIYKYIIYDQKFISESFTSMAEKHFDFKALPEFKPFFSEEYMIRNQVKEIFREEKFAQEVKSLLLSTYHIDDLIQQLFQAISKENKIDRIGIAFVDYSRQKFVAEYGISSYTDIALGPGFEVDFHRTSLKAILDTKSSVITKDLNEAYRENPKSPSLRLITSEGIQSNLVVPVLMGEVVFGLIFFSSREKDYFNATHVRIAEKMIYEISGFLNRSYFTKVILSKITNSFSELVDQKDNETGGHIRRMVAYSVVIAKGLLKNPVPGYEVNEKFVLEIERNASAHDIGKVGIPDEILKKPGKLTSEEWVIMKTHTTIGADIFKSLREGLRVFESDFYLFAEEIARSHHERYDGTGYPHGLKGKDIPLSARIVAIADVFDALTSKRHYKDAFGFENSLKIIKESAGNHLDPILVGVFLEHIDEIKHISQM